MRRFDKINSIMHPNDPDNPGFLAWYPQYYGTKQEIILRCNPQMICEIGVRAGYSAMAFLDVCPDAIYFGFDANNGQHGGQIDFTDWACKLLDNEAYAYKIWYPFDTQTVSVLPVRADFYHVDGDHTCKGAYHDIRMCFEDMLSGSHILVDDYDHLPDVKQAVDMFLADYKGGLTWEYIKSHRGEILIRKR